MTAAAARPRLKLELTSRGKASNDLATAAAAAVRQALGLAPDDDARLVPAKERLRAAFACWAEVGPALEAVAPIIRWHCQRLHQPWGGSGVEDLESEVRIDLAASIALYSARRGSWTNYVQRAVWWHVSNVQRRNARALGARRCEPADADPGAAFDAILAFTPAPAESADAAGERRERAEALADAFPRLLSRHRFVLERRFGLADGERRTLRAVGEEMGITKERVRQLQLKAIESLRQKLEATP